VNRKTPLPVGQTGERGQKKGEHKNIDNTITGHAQVSRKANMLKALIVKREDLAAQIAAIQATIQPQIEPLQTQLAELQDKIEKISTQAAIEAYRQAGKDTGTCEFIHEDVRIKSVVDKKVEWDQARLSQIRERIRGTGDDPGQYIQEKLSVSEKAFTAWPEQIKAVFLPARTVKPGKPKFEYLVLDPEDAIPF